MFKEYESKPITRKALKVTADMEIHNVGNVESTSRCEYRDGLGMLQTVIYKHYEPVSVGDYIVYLNDSDIYHCTEEVFKARNVTEGVDE